MNRRLYLSLAMLVLLGATWPACSQPIFSDTGPDAAGYGSAEGYPIARPGGPIWPQAVMVGAFSHLDTLFPFHRVQKPPIASPLRRAESEIAVRYRYEGAAYTLDDYLRRNPTTALLIARDDTILFEHYQYNRTDRDRLTSWSMAKTVTSMLI